jgi:hypothetical protein
MTGSTLVENPRKARGVSHIVPGLKLRVLPIADVFPTNPRRKVNNMIVLELNHGALEVALSEVFSNTSKEGMRICRLLTEGEAILRLSNKDSWCITRAPEMQQKIRPRRKWRELASVLNSTEHYLFVNYTNPHLGQVYCAECCEWMNLSKKPQRFTGQFKIIERPLDN